MDESKKAMFAHAHKKEVKKQAFLNVTSYLTSTQEATSSQLSTHSKSEMPSMVNWAVKVDAY